MDSRKASMKITHVNPDMLPKNPAFSQTGQAYRNTLEILKSLGASQKMS